MRSRVVTIVVALTVAFPAESALGDFTIFTDKGSFALFNQLEGKTQKLTESFFESNLLAGQTATLNDPLIGNVPNVDQIGRGFPIGLLSKNLIIQSNTLGVNAPVPSPLGVGGLAVLGPFFGGQDNPNSVVVGAALPDHSTDLIFTEPNHTGVGFDVIDLFVGGSTIHITVFDKGNGIITKETVPGLPGKTFFGIWSDRTIGRINIDSVPFPGDPVGRELVDNIQMWTPAPGGLALFGLAGLMGTRRRRK